MYDHVIKIGCDKANSIENDVHHLLKGHWGSLETELHDLELKHTIWGGKCSFGLLFLTDRYWPITPGQVKGGDEPRFAKPIY